MALFKRKGNTYQGSEEDNTEDYDQYESEDESEDGDGDEAGAEVQEMEEEEQEPEPEESNSAPAHVVRPNSFSRVKRAPAVPASPVTPPPPEIPPPVVTPQPAVTPPPVAAASKDKADNNKVYLTAKVNRELHSRLKVHSYKVHKTIVQLLEELIAQHIPEV